MSEKIHNTHLERAAYIYIRQSTMHQVREHLESQRRQYELAEKARQFKFREVVVIDDDLGAREQARRRGQVLENYWRRYVMAV